MVSPSVFVVPVNFNFFFCHYHLPIHMPAINADVEVGADDVVDVDVAASVDVGVEGLKNHDVDVDVDVGTPNSL